MTSHPLENEVGPRRLSDDERAEGDFVRGIASGHGHRAIAISDLGGHWFWAQCPQCLFRGKRWHGADGKSEAAQEAEWHNDRGRDEEARS